MVREQRESGRIPALDGWRGFAILLVLIDHAAESSHSGWIHKLTRVGATGVGIFFALSGFLITSRLLAEHARRGNIDFQKFYIRRVFRLLPPAVVYLSVLTILTAFGFIAVTREQVLSCLFLFRNYIATGQGSSGWFTGHFWSLNVEEHFYLVWPLLLVATRRRLLVPIMLALSVAAWRYVDITYNIVPATVIWLPGRTDIRLDALLWGCILAIAMAMPGVQEKLFRSLPGLAVLGLAALDIFSNVRKGQHDYSPYEPVILALIVIWPILRPGSALSALLDWKPVKWFGALSYSLYIWQSLWLLYPGAPAPFGKFQHLPLNLALVLACAILSYYLVEKPMIAIGHRLTGVKVLVYAEKTAA